MNPNNLFVQSCVIPAQAGIQQEQTFREADKTSRLQRVSRNGQTAILSRFAGDFLINWIPACAGMTLFCAN